jgi:hypothetical protein
MAADYAAALDELYQAPHGSFVEERKRLAADLKAAGDKTGAAALGKRTRPTISAWVVNQLWWHARDAFESLLASAARLRDGDLAANAEHRASLTKLRTRAAAMLDDAGHGSTESTLRRVHQTIAAIAATGSWEPEAPGTLTSDRDPPGFDVAMLAPTVAGEQAEAAQRVVAMTETKKKKAAEVAAAAVKAREKLEAELVDEALAAEALEAEQEAAKQEAKKPVVETPIIPIRRAPTAPPAPAAAEILLGADRKALEAQLRAAKAELTAKEAAAEQLRARLADAKDAVAKARATVEDLQSQLDDE